VLRGLESIRIKDNAFCLPGDTTGGHFKGLSKAWQRMRKLANLGDVRLHDLRHSWASVAVADGASLFIVGKALGHRSTQTTERYSHLRDDPVTAVARKTARKIALAMAGG
jgi:integrase